MRYDPVKDRFARFFNRSYLLQRLFYGLLDLLFLRAWYVRRELRALLGRGHERVLDAGTGFGQYAHFVARTFPQTEVVAVDVKEEYLAHARAHLARTRHHDRVTFVVDDLTNLQISGPFDCILSVDVMEHIEEDVAVLRHFAHVARPGGYVLINTPSDLGGSDAQVEGPGGFIDEHVREGYSLEELQSKLREAGLTPIRGFYTYGRCGSLAWRLLIKLPLRALNLSWAFVVLLPFYYLLAAPAGLLLHACDMRNHHHAGTGLLVVAQKPAGSFGP